jgi:hypothetical protein
MADAPFEFEKLEVYQDTAKGFVSDLGQNPDTLSSGVSVSRVSRVCPEARHTRPPLHPSEMQSRETRSRSTPVGHGEGVCVRPRQNPDTLSVWRVREPCLPGLPGGKANAAASASE